MREKKLYVCEICGTEYADKRKAEECETAHVKPKRLTKKMKFHAYGSGRDPALASYQPEPYPDWIDIEMSDGNTVRYKR